MCPFPVLVRSNIHLLTLKDTGESFLVRLAHLYQVCGHAPRCVQVGQLPLATPPRPAGPASNRCVPMCHLLQEGEHPTLSRPITENLNAVLQLLQYSAVRACLLVGWQSAAVLVRLPLGIQLAADSPPPACAPADQRTVAVEHPDACRHAARPPALPGWR